MYTIYVLKSEKDGNLYIGCTSNIANRLKVHNQGGVASTRSRRPFNLIYQESYTDKYRAFEKERFYKTVKGKKELMSKLK